MKEKSAKLKNIPICLTILLTQPIMANTIDLASVSKHWHADESEVDFTEAGPHEVSFIGNDIHENIRVNFNLKNDWIINNYTTLKFTDRPAMSGNIAGSSYIINNFGNILGSSDYGMSLFKTGNVTINNSGLIHADELENLDAIHIETDPTLEADVNIYNTGTIHAGFSNTIEIKNANNVFIHNQAEGEIIAEGTRFAIWPIFNDKAVVINDGSITAFTTTAFSPTFAGTHAHAVIINNGIIDSEGLVYHQLNRKDLTTDQLRLDIVNTGTINIALTAINGNYSALGTIAISNSGTLIAGKSGLYQANGIVDKLIFENRGLFEAQDGHAIYLKTLKSAALVHISNNGKLKGTASAIRIINDNAQIDVKIHNGKAGYILGDTTDNTHAIGIRNGSVSIINEGDIIAQSGTGIDLQNSPDGESTAYIINTGLIKGGNNTAIRLANGNNKLILMSGSSLEGKVDGLIGNDDVFLLGSGNEDDSFIAAESLSVQGQEWSLSGMLEFEEKVNIQRGTLKLSNQGNAYTTEGALFSKNTTIHKNANLAILTDYQITGNLINNGIIIIDKDTAYNTLTLMGDYSAEKGQLIVNTSWNNTPSSIHGISYSDLLNIKGTAKGVTTVTTHGDIIGDITAKEAGIFSADVIKVTDSEHTGLFVGKTNTTNAGQAQLVRKDSNTYAWTLKAKDHQDQFSDIYSPDITAYAVMPKVNMELGYTMLGTLHERRGDNIIVINNMYGDKNGNQTWGRIFGSHLNQNGKKRLNFKSNITGLQLGHDFATIYGENSSRHLIGGYFAYGHSNTKFYDQLSAQNGLIINDKYTGKGKTDSYSLGITSTYYSPKSTYIDLVGQITHFRNQYESREQKNIKKNGWGALISAEIGKSFTFHPNSSQAYNYWTIEPQAQMIYQYLHLKKFNDGVRNINQKNQNGLRARIGARFAYNMKGKNEQNNSVYAIVNIWHDFLNEKNISIGRDQVRDQYAKTWGEIGIGAQYATSKNTAIYIDTRYEHDFGNTKRSGYRGSIGFKYTW